MIKFYFIRYITFVPWMKKKLGYAIVEWLFLMISPRLLRCSWKNRWTRIKYSIQVKLILKYHWTLSETILIFLTDTMRKVHRCSWKLKATCKSIESKVRCLSKQHQWKINKQKSYNFLHTLSLCQIFHIVSYQWKKNMQLSVIFVRIRDISELIW